MMTILLLKVGLTDSANPTTTTTDVEPQFESGTVTWADEYVPEVKHQWLWLQEALPPPEDETKAGDLGAQQQATFAMLHALADSSKCASISWDPKGSVLDAQTLYPVKGVAITLSQKGIDGTYADVPSKIGLTNPDISQSRSGQYSFYTAAGTYKLRVTSANATMVDISAMNPLYKSVFTLNDPISTMYKADQEIIEQTGKVAVSHVPVTVTSDSMLVKDLAVMWRKEEKSVGDEILFSGALTHPKSLIKLVTTYVDKDGVISQDTKTEMTNEIGEYKFFLAQVKTVPQTKLSEEKMLFLTKYDVTFSLNPAIYSNPGIQSPQNSFSGEVIPAYIDGIAYGEDNKPLVDAIVGVYPIYSDKAIAYAITDEAGRYIIGSQHIPQFSYALRYKKSTGEVIKVSTSTFVKQNAAYFIANEILPFSQRITTPAEEKAALALFKTVSGNKIPDMRVASDANKNSSTSKSGSRLDGQQQEGVATSNPQKGIAGMQGIIMIVVVLLILLMLGVGAFIMAKSKQSQTPTQPKI
ncbi:MAG: hypothetical protein NTZ55_02100 [Candidatus Roizmanbacteria bacterium]|nr:hypothetical protein [Candidatus Roizmanbacteria bacterium]